MSILIITASKNILKHLELIVFHLFLNCVKVWINLSVNL